MSYFFLYELFGPVIEFTGYFIFLLSYSFGIVDTSFMVLFLSVSIVFGIFLSVSAIALDELMFGKYPRYSHIIKLFVFSLLENFG